MIRAKPRMGGIPIRVHGWGGLGSQILACVVAKRLTSIFPARKVVLILHSSGVTRRVIEIPEELTRGFTVVTQDDFKNSNVARKTNNSEIARESNFRNSVTFFFERLGILARLNTQQEFSELKACVYEVRGHYAQISLTPEEVSWIANCLNISSAQKRKHKPHLIVLHLRLGDLLTLPTKSYINLNRLSSAIKSVSLQGKVTIFSDSEPSEVEDLLQDAFEGIEYQVKRESAIKVIQEGAICDLFIGTNSKISLWIAIFRRSLSIGHTTLLPKEISQQLDVLAPKTRKYNCVFEY